MKKAFKNAPLTIDELKLWKENPLINPRTNKSIKENSITFNLINKAYKKIKYNNYQLLDCIDDRDPISMNLFWVEQGDKRKIIYPNELIDDLVFYKDSHKNLRCLEKESLKYLKFYNIVTHPITLEELPHDIFLNIDPIALANKTVSAIALDVFQHLEKISIFIDYELFMELNKEKLIKFNYELRDFWLNNFSETERYQINYKELFKKKSEDLNNIDIEEIQIYILNEILVLLKCEQSKFKYMINYIIVCALGIIIPKIKEFYPDFVFGF